MKVLSQNDVALEKGKKQIYRYELIRSETETENNVRHVVYGIGVKQVGQSQYIHKFQDICPYQNVVENLMDKIQKLGVSPVHLPDIIEDFLFEQYTI